MKAAVLEKINSPLAITDIHLRNDPILFHGQVCVKMICAGICGAQIQEIRGVKGDPKYLPHLLGHEGCGIVERSASGRFNKGDKVIIHWRKGDGCEAELPSLELGAGPCTTFSERTIISENRCTKVPDDFPADLGALFGCSLSTALATIENECRWAQSILIVGCGGVGLSFILVARLVYPSFLAAYDKAKVKSKLARSLGAIFFDDPFTEGKFDIIIDTIGDLSWVQNLKPSGKYILVGQHYKWALVNPGQLFEGEGKSIKATQAGGFRPSIDIPRYVNLWRSDVLDNYPRIIGHRIALNDINHGIELMKTGRAMGRIMIDFR